MKKFAKGIVKCRVMLLILAVALLIQSAIGYFTGYMGITFRNFPNSSSWHGNGHRRMFLVAF